MEEAKISSALKAVGLSTNEVSIYLDLIRSGKSVVSDIAKRTKIHRSNIYDILEKLSEKGFVEESIYNDKKYYYPLDPEKIVNILKQKQAELTQIIPEIKSIQNKPNETTKVTISEGLASVRSLLLSLLECGKEIYIYGTPKGGGDLLGGFINEFHKLRIKKKIILKHIYGVDSIKRVKELNDMDFTEAKYLPFGQTKVSTNICGSKVSLILWDSPISAITIENSEIAEAQKVYFNILWNEANEHSEVVP